MVFSFLSQKHLLRGTVQFSLLKAILLIINTYSCSPECAWSSLSLIYQASLCVSFWAWVLPVKFVTEKIYKYCLGRNRMFWIKFFSTNIRFSHASERSSTPSIQLVESNRRSNTESDFVVEYFLWKSVEIEGIKNRNWVHLWIEVNSYQWK